MEHESWEEVGLVPVGVPPEMLRGLLEAQGLTVRLDQEGAGAAYGLTIGKLGEVVILVPAHQVDEARQVLEDFYAGEYETGEDYSPPVV